MITINLKQTSNTDVSNLTRQVNRIFNFITFRLLKKQEIFDLAIHKLIFYFVTAILFSSLNLTH